MLIAGAAAAVPAEAWWGSQQVVPMSASAGYRQWADTPMLATDNGSTISNTTPPWRRLRPARGPRCDNVAGLQPETRTARARYYLRLCAFTKSQELSISFNFPSSKHCLLNRRRISTAQGRYWASGPLALSMVSPKDTKGMTSSNFMIKGRHGALLMVSSKDANEYTKSNSDGHYISLTLMCTFEKSLRYDWVSNTFISVYFNLADFQLIPLRTLSDDHSPRNSHQTLHGA